MAGAAKISFGIIVLNGEPFTRYALQALYPHAHEILVVEGACPGARGVATPDGHSTDDTVETIRRFQADEDPDGKIQLIQRDGFWKGKDEQSRAYAERASGDWLWQVDVDEFYRDEDLRRISLRLAAEPDLSGASFQQITFWGGLDYVCDGFYLRRGAEVYHRLFRWGPGYRYVTHRPPTVADASGRDLRTLEWLDAYEFAAQGIRLYHYSLLFPKQVHEKCAYYAATASIGRPHAEDWARTCFDELGRPYRVHNVYDHPSWLEHFRGEHPQAVVDMMEDARAGRLGASLRDCADVERLLAGRRYRAGRALLKAAEPLYGLAWNLAPAVRWARGNPEKSAAGAQDG